MYIALSACRLRKSSPSSGAHASHVPLYSPTAPGDVWWPPGFVRTIVCQPEHAPRRVSPLQHAAPCLPPSPTPPSPSHLLSPGCTLTRTILAFPSLAAAPADGSWPLAGSDCVIFPGYIFSSSTRARRHRTMPRPLVPPLDQVRTVFAPDLRRDDDKGERE